MENEINALAEFLGINPEDIRESNDYGDHVYYTDEGDYFVSDYDTAYKAAVEQVLSLVDDMGIQSFTEWAQEQIIDNFVDSEWFDEAKEESDRFYAQDIADESDDEFGNRLIRECYEENLITDEDFGTDENGEPDYSNCLISEDELVEKRATAMDEGWSDSIDWYRSDFGDEDFSKVVRDKNLIDWDAAAEWCVNTDGVANSLASYDGKENTQEYDGETYYIYRVN